MAPVAAALSPGKDAADPGLVWYIDGSLYDEPRRFARRTGFGIAVVDADGSLVACSYGQPPQWINDSAGAEVWAFQEVTAMTPCVPQVVTDCLGILRVLEAHPEIAVGPKQMHARTWIQIAANLDGDFQSARARTTWMPAHTSAASIGVSRDSNGLPISASMWRANRLADALAKYAASQDRLPMQATAWVRKVARAATEVAALLGAVTYAANHHEVPTVDAYGKATTRIVRDSSGCKQMWRRRSSLPRHDAESHCAHTDVTSTEAPPADDSPRAASVAGRGKKRLRANVRHAQAREEVAAQQQTARWLASQHLRPMQGPSACERMSALRDRIAARGAVS